ncbi:hypothetical protein T484DRAFT_1848190, partial [Baffinella frigidus]
MQIEKALSEALHRDGAATNVGAIGAANKPQAHNLTREAHNLKGDAGAHPSAFHDPPAHLVRRLASADPP